MIIKDKLAHYEPKPLGESGRYAVLLPLLYNEKNEKYQVLIKYEVNIFLSREKFLFQVDMPKMARLFKKPPYEKLVRN